MATLTKKQKEIFDFIQRYIKKYGISPTFEEICDHTKKAFSTVFEHVQALIEKGYLIKNENLSRGIEIKEKNEEMVKIPLLGSIAAGLPIEVIEEKETIALPKHKLLQQGKYFGLRVIGDSMKDEDINDGDVVIVRKQEDANRGQTVIALINNNEATLKKYYKEKDFIKLQPANKHFQPIIVDKKTPFNIQGLVIDIIKNEPSWTLQISTANNKKSLRQKKETTEKTGINALLNKVIEGDCLEVMKKIPDKSIDMILCDLPYGYTQNTWDSIIPLDKLWAQYERILKDNGVIALTAQGVFTAQLILSNPKMFKYKIVWVKSKSTNFLNAKKQPLRKHEDICIFYKQQPIYYPQMTKGEPFNKGFRKDQLTGSYGDFKTVEVKSDGERYPTDVIYFKTAESEGLVYHPTQKPVELGRYLIRTFTNHGDIILDNTCGSGSFLVSAVLEGRQFVGIEKNEEVYLHKKHKVNYIEICNKRILEAKDKVNIEKSQKSLF